MMAPTHTLFGLWLHIVLGAFWPEIFAADQVGTAMCAALLADTDLRQSWGGQLLGHWGKPLRWVLAGHRKYSHKWWSPIVVFVPGYLFISHEFGYAILSGYYSHLIGDKIPDTGGWLEKVIRFLLPLSVVLSIFYRIAPSVFWMVVRFPFVLIGMVF